MDWNHHGTRLVVCQQPVELVSQRRYEPIVSRARHEAQSAVGRRICRGRARWPGLPNRGVLRTFVDSGENLVAEYLTSAIEHRYHVPVKRRHVGLL
jgi:hypothetical protein